MGIKDFVLSFLPTRTVTETVEVECAEPGRGAFDCVPPVDNTCKLFDGPDTIDSAVREPLIAQSDLCDCIGSYYTKMLNLHAAMVIGKGPRLIINDEFITPDDAKHMKARWEAWMKASKFVSALRQIRRGAMKSGEGLGLFVTSDKQKDAVKMRLKSITCKRLKSPPTNDDKIKDGIRYDDNGDPEVFYISSGYNKVEEKEASQVVYFFSEILEEQARGIPELWSTLEWFPKIRSFQNAVLSANELFARMPVALAVNQAWIGEDERNEGGLCPGPGDKPIKLPTNGTWVPTLPKGTTLEKIQGSAPGTDAKQFLTTLVTMAVSPICMPAILIMGDACEASFSGANIDWEPYIGQIGIDRGCLEPACTQAFHEWLKEGSKIPGYFGPSVVAAVRGKEFADISHSWRWGRVKCHIDPQKEADARQTDLESGNMTLIETYDARSQDLEEEVERAAEFFGVTVKEYKKFLWEKIKRGGRNANTQTNRSAPQATSQS